MSDRVVRVGDLGTAVTAMCPSGAVLLDGRRVDARADIEAIPAGASVVVLRGDPTGYVVRRVGPDHPLPQLADTGAEIARPEFARNSAEVRRADGRDEAERERAWRAAARWRIRIVVVMGFFGGFLLEDWFAPPERLYRGAFGGSLGAATGICLSVPLLRAGRLFRWSSLAANAAVVAGFIGAGVGFWTGYELREPRLLFGGMGIGGLVGFWAGWWVATRLELVFGGPDEV